jgi:hypothetical protein
MGSGTPRIQPKTQIPSPPNPGDSCGHFPDGVRGSASLSGRSTWAHDASHRGGVPYSNSALTNRYRGNVRQNLQTRESGGQTQARGAAQSGGERMGNRRISSSTPAQNRSAFGGVREGRAARTQSDHGYSRLGAARSGGGGFSRGGGGGGMRGGGGGGGHR